MEKARRGNGSCIGGVSSFYGFERVRERKGVQGLWCGFSGLELYTSCMNSTLHSEEDYFSPMDVGTSPNHINHGASFFFYAWIYLIYLSY